MEHIERNTSMASPLETVTWRTKKRSRALPISPTEITESMITDAIKAASAVDDLMYSCNHCNFCCYDPEKFANHIFLRRPGTLLRCQNCPFESCTSSGLTEHTNEWHSSGIDPKSYPNIDDPVPEALKEKIEADQEAAASETNKDEQGMDDITIIYIKDPTKLPAANTATPSASAKPQEGGPREGLFEGKCIKFRKAKIRLVRIDADQKEQVVLKKTPKKFACPICTRAFKCKQTMKTHARNAHTEEKPYGCDQCTYKATQKKDLLRHKRTRESRSGKIHHCRECTFTSCTARYLRTHLMTAHIEMAARNIRKICTFCKSSFNTEAALERHIRSHTGEKPFKCEFCSFASPCASSLNSHKKNAKMPPYLCSYCTFTSCTFHYFHKHLLEAHHIVQTDARMVQKQPQAAESTLLPKSVQGRDEDLVKKRVDTHVQAIFECRFCDYEAKRRRTVVIHERVHSAGKPLVCKICAKRFFRRESLRRHRLTHGNPTSWNPGSDHVET